MVFEEEMDSKINDTTVEQLPQDDSIKSNSDKSADGAPLGYCFQAESLDDDALVSGASSTFGFQFVDRGSDTVNDSKKINTAQLIIFLSQLTFSLMERDIVGENDWNEYHLQFLIRRRQLAKLFMFQERIFRNDKDVCPSGSDFDWSFMFGS